MRVIVGSPRAVDLLDLLTRQLGRVVVVDPTNAFVLPTMDAIARAGFQQLVFGGAVIDPRAIRLLTLADVVKAREDSVAMTWVSARNAAPGIGAVQADTGALAAGDYDFDFQLAASDTVGVGKGLVVEHRNAANAATLFTLGGCPAADVIQLRLRRYTLLVNERIRVITGTVAGAAGSDYISAIGRRIS